MECHATVGEQWANPGYDANGNMTAIPRPGLNRPSWANLTTDQWSVLTVDDWSRMEVAPTFTATYDAWNRLVNLSEPPASAGGGWTPVQENQYDGRGYRIVVRNYSSGLPSPDSHLYSTDQWQCVEERLGTSSTPDRQFVWGVRYIDDLILRDRSVSGGTLGQPPAADERLYALQDANWNVTTIADSTGTVQERYKYDPYGVTTVLATDFTVRSASKFAWETTYCGYRWDAGTGLFAVRNRFYHPRLGAWLTRDPLTLNQNVQPSRGKGAWKQAASSYEYVRGKPVFAVDPSDLEMHIPCNDGSVHTVNDNTPRQFWCAGRGGPANVDPNNLPTELKPFLPPPPPPPPPPKKWEDGFYIVYDQVRDPKAQKCGLMHTDIVRVVNGSGTEIRTGAGGDSRGNRLPKNGDLPLQRLIRGSLTWGSGAGTPCSLANENAIESCVRSYPAKAYGPAGIYNNCQVDVTDAALQCCLTPGQIVGAGQFIVDFITGMGFGFAF